MEEGLVLLLALFGGFVGWLMMDGLFWLLGRQTATRWVIKEARASKFRAALFLLMVVLFAAWVIVHMELIPALMG